MSDTWVSLADNDALEDRDEVFNVNEGVFAAVNLECLEGFHDELAQIFSPLLTVVDAVSQVVYK